MFKNEVGVKQKGFTLVELLVVIAIIGILVSLLLPAIQAAREAARRSQCQNNLRNIALAMLNYETVRNHFPAAAYKVAEQPQETLSDAQLYTNWLIELLPQLEQQPLYDQIDAFWNVSDLLDPRRQRITNAANKVPNDTQEISTEVPIFLCPSDNGMGNYFTGGGSFPALVWARGNYGLNAYQYWGNNEANRMAAGTLDSTPTGDAARLANLIDFNVGIAPVGQKGFPIKRITDGTSNTIMIGEMRVGLSPRDRRGVWAMGMCGSSFHCRHASDIQGAVNSCGSGDDDVFGANDIVDDVGRETLLSECMMPETGGGSGGDFDFGIGSGESVVRSVHPGGAFVALADGSVRFISDFIDAGEIVGGYCIGCTQMDDILPGNFGVWQRLNASRDEMINLSE